MARTPLLSELSCVVHALCAYWLTSRDGFSAAPEGDPSATLSAATLRGRADLTCLPIKRAAQREHTRAPRFTDKNPNRQVQRPIMGLQNQASFSTERSRPP